MTSKTARLFLGGFAIACILIGALAGFLIVDMSTDRYMPGTFAPFYQISSISEEGVDIAFLGQTHHIDAEQALEVQQALWQWRGLIPRPLRAAAGLAVRLYDLVFA